MAEETKQLSATLKVGDDTYDINAVHSDSAAKLDKKLVIRKFSTTSAGIESRLLADFDGSSKKEIEIVPAKGGGNYVTPINVVNHSTKYPIQDTSILNYSEILDVVSQLRGYSWFTWSDTNNDKVLELTAVINDDEQLQQTSLVVGSSTDLEKFSQYNYEKKELPSYLYIDKTNGNIFFGTSDTNVATRLANNTVSADTATKLETARTIRTNLSSTTAVNFDGTKNITPGVTGILREINGGTGKTKLSDVTVGYATQLAAAPTLITDLSSNAGPKSFDGTKALAIAVSGVLPENKGGTGKTKLSDVTVGRAKRAEEADTVVANYMTSTGNTLNEDPKNISITVSPLTPTEFTDGSYGVDGDIWIKY